MQAAHVGAPAAAPAAGPAAVVASQPCRGTRARAVPGPAPSPLVASRSALLLALERLAGLAIPGLALPHGVHQVAAHPHAAAVEPPGRGRGQERGFEGGGSHVSPHISMVSAQAGWPKCCAPSSARQGVQGCYPSLCAGLPPLSLCAGVQKAAGWLRQSEPRVPPPPSPLPRLSRLWQVSQLSHTASSSSFSPWNASQAPQASAALAAAWCAAARVAAASSASAPWCRWCRALAAASRAAALPASRRN